MRTDASTRRQRVLELIAGGALPVTAAEQTGVSLRSVRRYLADPTTKRELGRIRDERLQQLAGRALNEAGPALATLRVILEDPLAPAAVRVSAASRLLDVALRLHEVTDLDARISALEATLGGARCP